MSKKEMESVEYLRTLGYAVVVFSPDELKGVPAEDMEEFLGEEGVAFIRSCEPDEEAPSRRKLTPYEQACWDAGVPPYGPL